MEVIDLGHEMVMHFKVGGHSFKNPLFNHLVYGWRCETLMPGICYVSILSLHAYLL